MSATELVSMVAKEVAEQAKKIDQLSMSQWVKLAKELDVEMNDRPHAAKKLAIQALKRDGKLV